MPGFGDPFTGLKLDRMLTKEELIRSVRFMLAAEIEAVEMYTRVAEACQDEKIKKLILDIADEERVHAGEFGKLVEVLDPQEKVLLEKGMAEAEEKLKTAKIPLANSLRRLAEYVHVIGGNGLKTLKWKSPYSGKLFTVGQ